MSPLTTRARPCDTCRARKTRCVKPPDRRECILCAFHGKQCTYLRGPLARPRPTSSAPSISTVSAPVSASASASSSSMSMSMFSDAMTLDSAPSPEAYYSPNSPNSAQSPEANTIVTSPDALSLTRSNATATTNTTASNSYYNPTSASFNSNPNTAAVDTPNDATGDDDTFSAMVSLLAGTVGLDLNTHPEFIGPSSYHEPELLGLCRVDNAPAAGVSPQATRDGQSMHHQHHQQQQQQQPRPTMFVRLARRVDSKFTFLMYPDEATASEPQRIADCDAIEDTVRPAGKALVDLYFRIVHPCFPILHKGVYVSKYAFSHRMFSPPLLAAVYLVALDYHLYASSLPGNSSVGAGGGDALSVSAERQAALETLAERTMADDLRRPKLSTLQAGLLLLQRRKFGMGPSSSLFTAQLVAVAQNLGLHVDCQDWSIPSWEKGLRRRLAAVLYTQDRWGALVHGRPALLHDDNWDLQPCSLADFPEVDEDLLSADTDGSNSSSGGVGGNSGGSGGTGMEEGSINTDVGYEAFIQQTELAHILSDIMAKFYSTAACKRGGTLERMTANPAEAMAVAAPILARLRSWHAALPDALALDCIQHRRLSASAPLHVARAAVEVALHRALLRLMTADTPADIAAQVRGMARSHVLASLATLSGLQPEHTGAFWSGVAAYQIVSIGSLIGLLWATTEDADELDWCTRRMDALRWALRLRGRAAPFMQEALRLLETVAAPLGMAANNRAQQPGGEG